MKNVLLITIPHTGTRFFLKLLEQQYFNSRHHIMRETTEPRPLKQYLFATCHTANWKLILEYIEKYNPVVITCERRYEDVITSFVKRKGDRAEAEYKRHLDGWNILKETITPDVVLSVDAEDKEDRLEKLSKVLGVSLDPEGWGKVGSWEDKNKGRGRDWPI